ncbi:hypothetical protein ACFO1B_08030 [Dactylosporangium siamense]|uniref:Glyoxalase-like domain-containing protein n=1 Tax=Dactylosporangium siamense TaxID=685454 RepID=A0A919PTB6_9ACTN|nr:hypothetical protein [Dactylosporangium siamense]GIG48065.1 hypothetical protein Dsi01nite_061060 [Dactylosporangium siamense]
MTSDHAQRSGLVEWMAMTVDCPEPNVMADFYAALLGGTVTSRVAGEAKLDAAGRYRGSSPQSPQVTLPRSLMLWWTQLYG